MYLACGNDGIYKMDNNKITPIPKFHDEAMVTKFRVTNAGLIGMVDENSESDHWLTHFDGNKWSAHNIFVKLW